MDPFPTGSFVDCRTHRRGRPSIHYGMIATGDHSYFDPLREAQRPCVECPQTERKGGAMHRPYRGCTMTAAPGNEKGRDPHGSRLSFYFAFFLKMKLRKRMIFITRKKATRMISVR